MSHLSLRAKILMAVVLSFLVGTSANLVIVLYQLSHVITEDTKQLVRATAYQYAGDVTSDLQVSMDYTRAITHGFEELVEEGLASREAADAMLRGIVERNSDFLGFWSMWEPNAFDGKDAEYAGKDPGTDETGRFLPYWNRGDKEVAVEPSVEYNDPEEYYQVTLHGGREVMDDPGIYPVAGKDVMMTSAMIPVKVHGKYVGVNGIDIDMNDLQKKISKLRPFDVGYVSIVASNGEYISAIDPKLNGKPIGDSGEMKAAVDAIQNGKEYAYQGMDPTLNEEVYAVYVPIKIGDSAKNWSCVVTLPMSFITAKTNNITHLIILVSLLCVLPGIGIALLTSRSISKPIVAMTAAMGSLASGKHDIDIPATGRKDEIGRMADALGVFKSNAVAVAGRAEQDKAEQRLKEKKYEEMQMLAAKFQQGTQKVIEVLIQSATTMQNKSSIMSNLVAQNARKSGEVVRLADQANANMTTVASSTEELTASIGEIAAQADRSNRMTEGAVRDAEKSSKTIHDLSAAVVRIREVVDLIDGIAAQTNLLALNATIEAARAGAAGKGFSVVASEVKNLAAQTGNATRNISDMIGEIISTTEAAVHDVNSINQAIEEVSAGINQIAASMDAQSKATQEIASSAQHITMNNQQVIEAIGEVQVATGETGQSVEEVLTVAKQLAEQAAVLRREIETFLQGVMKN
ncbi:MAG: methyl-accepting chemotaxis protein [Rickettsiales bacterium]